MSIYKNKINRINYLCDGYKKNGGGECPNPGRCKKFHPKRLCSKANSCNKLICPFLHFSDYYITDKCISCNIDLKNEFLEINNKNISYIYKILDD